MINLCRLLCNMAWQSVEQIPMMATRLCAFPKTREVPEF